MAKTKTEKQLVLVKVNYNWADEADFPSFEIWEREKLAEAKKKVKKFFDNDCNFQYYVGTNEDVEFFCYEDVFSDVETKTVSQEEYEVLRKFFGSGFGSPKLSDIIGKMNEVEEESKDDEEDKDE